MLADPFKVHFEYEPVVITISRPDGASFTSPSQKDENETSIVFPGADVARIANPFGFTTPADAFAYDP